MWHDQIAFREAIFDSQIGFSVLTPEYNFRSTFSTYLENEVKNIHSRRKEYSNYVKKIDLSKRLRVVIPFIVVVNCSGSFFKVLNKIFS